MARLPKNRLNKMRRLSTMIEPMVAHSARERGFSISRIISHWRDTVGDLAEWCRPADIYFPRGSRNNGTPKTANHIRAWPASTGHDAADH